MNTPSIERLFANHVFVSRLLDFAVYFVIALTAQWWHVFLIMGYGLWCNYDAEHKIRLLAAMGKPR